MFLQAMSQSWTRLVWKYGQIRTRQKILSIIVIAIIIAVLFRINFFAIPECYRSVRIMLLVMTPLREKRNTCPIGAVDQEGDVDTAITRYVSHEEIGGRIGNLMFQTASTFGIAHALRAKTYIEPTHPLLPYFNIIPSKEINLDNSITLSEKECIDSVWRCRKEIYSHNVTVEGYLQSWKHFHHIAPVIRERLTPKAFYREQAKSFKDSLKPQNRTLIGIHVRRGDFIETYYRRCGYTTATANYFKRAMDIYRKEYRNALFVVISNDMQWCYENIVASDVIYSVFDDPIADLSLMSMCDHMIMSGGTFGWWGSWLAGGKVIYLKDWPRPGSWLDLFGMIKEDFFPPEWIGIENCATLTKANAFLLVMHVLFMRHC